MCIYIYILPYYILILQGSVYLMLAVVAVLNMLAFLITKKHCFIYLAAAFTISLGTYLGFYRTQIRRKFNIRVSSSLFGSIFHSLFLEVKWRLNLSINP